MAQTTYHYSIQNDFPNHKVDSTRLAQEIQASTIITALDYISTSGDDCAIVFKDALSVGDKTTLDGIVATHSGAPMPNDIPQPVQLYSADAKPSPMTTDGRSITLANLFPDYVVLYFAGCGDDRVLGRGKGPSFILESDVAGETSVDFQFNDWVYVAGGSLKCQNAQAGDTITFAAHAPATPVTPNGSNTGNCNLVDPGLGAAVLIVPAAGNGAFDVDLTQAVPVNAFNTDVPRAATGFWNWSAPDTGLGVITPGVPQKSNYNLFAIPLDPMVIFVQKFPLLGDEDINMTIPAISPKTFLPQWKQRVTVHNIGHAGLKVVFRIVTARVKST
jgi:hypothetical protein